MVNIGPSIALRFTSNRLLETLPAKRSTRWSRDLLRGPKAKLEYDRLAELARRGIATVQPLAWGRFESASPKGSFLITQSLDDAMPLDHYLAVHPPAAMSARNQLTLALAGYISSLHSVGVSRPDFIRGICSSGRTRESPGFF